MSADNWAICPECNARKLEEIEFLKQELHDDYGKVSEQEYATQRRRIEKIKPQGSRTSLREDYEVGIREGEFYVNYGAYCSKCEFEFTYNYSEDLTKNQGE